MIVHGILCAVRRAMTGIMFLSVALAARSALAAWQTDDSALLGVGLVALLAIAAAIHYRVGLIHQRRNGKKSNLRRSARTVTWRQSSKRPGFMW
jgi:hypothetical protein